MAGIGRALSVALLISAAACGSRAPGVVAPSPSLATSSPVPTRSEPAQIPTTLPSATAAPAREAVIRARATQAISALRARDLARFAALVHPTQGARFTPYTFVQPPRDVVLTRAALAAAAGSAQRYLWGHTDGKGDPMEWTFDEYYARHLWTKDYSVAPTVRFDHYPEVRGNRFDNTLRIYPRAHTVEYFYPASPNTLDWSGLRLVFEQHADEWWIVGVIHDEWTI